MRPATLLLGLILAIGGPAFAQDSGFGPDIPKASGEPHPEGNDYMRRWHMTMMRHDRDLTMYDGNRNVGASIGECFECHTVKDANNIPVTFGDERHFCRTCHDYAAVRIDCFDCHRSTPEGFEEPQPHASYRALPARREPLQSEIVEMALSYLNALPGAVEGEAR